eukprot:UN29616
MEKPSVENAVHDAIVKAGGIQEERNRGELKKLSWGRASRVDKGVHAASLVLSCRMNIWNNDYNIMTNELNKQLPDDIVCHHIQHVVKSFNPHHGCGSREYEYVCPSYCFADKTYDIKYTLTQEKREQLEKWCAQFLGTHRFHNFTKSKNYSDKDAK